MKATVLSFIDTTAGPCECERKQTVDGLLCDRLVFAQFANSVSNRCL